MTPDPSAHLSKATNHRFPAAVLALSTALLMVLTASRAAEAQETAVTVDLFRGPVVSSARVIGLGGAYAGIGEGVQGMGSIGASGGNRYPYSTTWFDWDFTLDWLNLAPGDYVDMDNDGRAVGDESYTALNVGVGFLLGRFGMGVWVSGDTFTLESESERIDYGFVRSVIAFTYALWREQLVAGVGLTSASMNVTTFANMSSPGVAPSWQGDGSGSWSKPGGQFSLLWRPHELPIRVGADLLLPIEVEADIDGEHSLANVGVPDLAVLPLRVALGASYYYSPEGHAYNRERTSSDNPFTLQEKREEEGLEVSPVDRRYLLLAMDVVINGSAPKGAVAPGSYAVGHLRTSGSTPTLSLHTGVEAEVWNNRLVVRGGGYLEPARIEGSDSRLHGTMRLDVRLFRLWLWQLRAGASLDIARSYLNWGIGVGFWH